MSEHAPKAHPIGALIMVVIIVALTVLGIGAMNGGDTASAMMLVPLLGGFGIYVVLSLARA